MRFTERRSVSVEVEGSGRTFWATIARDSSFLVGGQAGASLIRLLNLGIAARVLGPEAYGSVALIMAYAATVDRLCNFQTWQPVIHFGADLLGARSRERLSKLLSLGFTIDLVTAVSAAGVGLGVSFVVFPHFGWDPQFSTLGRIYLVTVPFHATGAVKGALRLFGRFDLIGKQSVWGPAVALGLFVSVGLSVGLSPLMVVVIYGLADIFASMVYLVYGRLVLGSRGMQPSWWATEWRELAGEFPGFTRFLLSSNLNGTSKLAVTSLDTVLSGIVLGPVGAAFYRIIKSIARVITTLSGAVYETIYPEFAKMVADDRIPEMMAFGRRIGLFLVMGAVAVVVSFAVIGAPGIRLALGVEYAPIYGGFLAYGLGLSLQMLGVPVSAMLLALNLPTEALRWYWAAAVVFTVAFLIAGSTLGLLGACAAFSLYWVVFLVGTWRLIRRTAAVSLRTADAPQGS